jgi:hypothetical protein
VEDQQTNFGGTNADDYEGEEEKEKNDTPPRRTSNAPRLVPSTLELESNPWMARRLAELYPGTLEDTDGEPLVHHRNVGMEIEVKNWFVQTKKKSPLAKWKCLFETTDCVLREEGVFELQAELGGHLEFVTTHPTASGVREAPDYLLYAVERSAELAGLIAKCTAAKNQVSRVGRPRLSKGMSGLTLGRKGRVRIAHLENLSNPLAGDVQVTAGIHPSAIRRFIRNCGRIEATGPGHLDHVEARVDAIIRTALEHEHIVSPELEGLLLLIHYYFQTLHGPTAKATEQPPKGQLCAMVRTSFAKIFSLVPEHEALAGAAWVDFARGEIEDSSIVINQVFDLRSIPRDAKLGRYRKWAWPAELDCDDAARIEKWIRTRDGGRGPALDAFTTWRAQRETNDDDARMFAWLSEKTHWRSASSLLDGLENAIAAGYDGRVLFAHPALRTSVDVTFAQWLNGMCLGTDLLSNWDGRNPILKTMGMLDRCDDLGAGASGVIIELREFSALRPPEEWCVWAQRATRFVAKVNTRATREDARCAHEQLVALVRRASTKRSKSVIRKLDRLAGDCEFLEQLFALVRRAELCVELDERPLAAERKGD